MTRWEDPTVPALEFKIVISLFSAASTKEQLYAVQQEASGPVTQSQWVNAEGIFHGQTDEMNQESR